MSILKFIFRVFFADPFVKVYLVVNGKRVKKKKSATRKGTTNPVWNEALTFSLSSSNLNNAAIEVKKFIDSMFQFTLILILNVDVYFW